MEKLLQLKRLKRPCLMFAVSYRFLWKAFGSDGASAQEWCYSKAKRSSPALLAIHSVPAVATALFLVSRNISVTLQTIFQKSSVRTAHLHEIQHVLGDPSQKFKEPKPVCWLSHGKAVTTV